jgi:hypothetical protein
MRIHKGIIGAASCGHRGAPSGNLGMNTIDSEYAVTFLDENTTRGNCNV